MGNFICPRGVQFRSGEDRQMCSQLTGKLWDGQVDDGRHKHVEQRLLEGDVPTVT